MDNQPLRVHIGHHMVSLALFALPLVGDDQTQDYASNQGQAGISEGESDIQISAQASSESDVMSEISEAANEETVTEMPFEKGESYPGAVSPIARAGNFAGDHPIPTEKSHHFWNRAYQDLRHQDLWKDYEHYLVDLLELEADQFHKNTAVSPPLITEQMSSLVLKVDVLEIANHVSPSFDEGDSLIKSLLVGKYNIAMKDSPDWQATFAWAGVCLLLRLLLEPPLDSDGDQDALDTAGVFELLDYMSALISRLVLTQYLYQQQSASRGYNIPKEDKQFEPPSEHQMILLCTQILDCQARAIIDLLILKKPWNESCLPMLIVDLRKGVADCSEINNMVNQQQLHDAMAQREGLMGDLFIREKQKRQEGSKVSKRRELIENAHKEQVAAPRHSNNVACFNALRTSDHECRKELVPDPVSGTFQWLHRHPNFLRWSLNESSTRTLWISTGAGNGKSVFAKPLVDGELLRLPRNYTCYYFFRGDATRSNDISIAFCALLHQLCSQNPALLQVAASAFRRNGGKIKHEFSWL